MSDNRKFFQLQIQTLAGSGCVVGATTIVLTNFLDIDGNLVTMTGFGTKGFGTLEPGNSVQEEQISFTGITQNANGTATLTGVKNVGFGYPYTETVGVLKSHVGGAQFIISNTSGFYDSFANKEDDETINGTYTFTAKPTFQLGLDAGGAKITTVSNPSAPSDAATKNYVDGIVVSGSAVTSFLVIKNGADPTLLVDVGSGYYVNGVTTTAYAGAVAQAVAASNTNYVQLTKAGTLVINTVSYTVGNLSLARVITNGTTVTSIIDDRAWLTMALTTDQVAALVGTSGTPSSSNKYVTNDDTSSAAVADKVVRASGTALPALAGSALTSLPAPTTLTGVSGNVTAANLNALTGGGQTFLHYHGFASGTQTFTTSSTVTVTVGFRARLVRITGNIGDKTSFGFSSGSNDGLGNTTIYFENFASGANVVGSRSWFLRAGSAIINEGITNNFTATSFDLVNTNTGGAGFTAYLLWEAYG